MTRAGDPGTLQFPIAHTTLKSGYASLVERLNRFPQGAPPADVLYKILALLFSEKEARHVALLPIKPFTAEKAAISWRMTVDEARVILDELAGRAILLDMEDPWGRQIKERIPRGRPTRRIRSHRFA